MHSTAQILERQCVLRPFWVGPLHDLLSSFLHRRKYFLKEIQTQEIHRLSKEFGLLQVDQQAMISVGLEDPPKQMQVFFKGLGAGNGVIHMKFTPLASLLLCISRTPVVARGHIH